MSDTTLQAPSSRPDTSRTIDVAEQVRAELAESFELRVEQLEAQWREHAAERRAIAELIEFAHGDQIAITPGMPHETRDHQDTKPRFAPNFLGDALEKLSYLYAADPVREVTRRTHAKVWDRILWSHRHTLTGSLAYYDPLIRLTGTCLALAIPCFGLDAQDLAAALNEQRTDAEAVDVCVFTPDRWVALAHPADGRQVGAVAVHWETVRTVERDERGQPIGRKDVEVHHYWDDERWAVLHDWRPVEAVDHDMGQAPATTLKNTLSPMSIYGRRMGGRDLVTNVKTVNGLFEEILHTARLQRGQWVLGQGKKNLVLGPDVAYECDDVNQVKCVANQANVDAMLGALKHALDALEIGLGLPRGTFRLGDTASRTASQLLADDFQLAKDRRKRSVVALDWERGIHRAAAAVWRTWGGEDLELPRRVTHMQVPPPLTHDEAMAKAEFMLDRGLRDERDTARMLEPHLTDDELEAMVERGQQALLERARMQATVAGHARDVDGGLPDPDQNDGQQDAQDIAQGTPRPDARVDRSQASATTSESAPKPTAGHSAPAVDIQRTALNGAQMQAVQAMAQAVSEGRLPRDTAFEFIALGYPDWDETRIGRALDAAVKMVSSPKAAPTPPPEPSGPPPNEDQRAT